ncbi:MAG: toprim domain-containing protein [Candidatus Pacearchaeota archaeon]|nr:toprim domain-containing protein [Candidatus Pacearchaeota archaeon]
MKLNPQLKHDIEKYFDYIIIVEGKKDVSSLKSLGFKRVYALHETSVPIKDRLLQISKEITKKEKVCILTDFDKKGKKLYMLIKQILQELGVKTDSTLRGILLKANISHIEGLYSLLKHLEQF